MAHLYELVAGYATIQDLIERGDDNDWLPALESLQGDIAEKAENIAKMVRTLEAQAHVTGMEAAYLKAKQKAQENAADRLREYLKRNLEAVGIDKVKGPLFTVAIQANPPACIIHEEAEVPDKYKVLVPEHWELAPDAKRRIVEDWKADPGYIPGVEISRGSHLRVR